MAGSALHAGQAAPGASEAARLSFLLRAGAPAFLIQLFGEKSARCCLPKAPGKVLNYSPGPADSETFLPGTAGFGWGQRFFWDGSLGGTVPARPGLGQRSPGPGRGLVREAPAALRGADSPRPASAAAQEGGGGRRVNSEGPGTLPANGILIP